MFHVPNDTTFNRGLDNSKIVTMMLHAYHEFKNGNAGQLIPIQTGDVHDNCFLFALSTGKDYDPKPFPHPVRFIDDEDYITIFDARTSTRFDRTTGEPVVNNSALFRRDLIIAILEDLWISEGPKEVLRLGHMQVYSFAFWIANIITRRFALDPAQQIKLTIIAAYYYICLCYPEKEVPELRSAVTVIARSLGMAASYILTTADNLPYMGDIHTFVEVVVDQLETDRLSGFTADILATLLAGTWFGPNNSLLVATAIEYPPVFASLVYLSLTDRANRGTGLAGIVLKKERDPMAVEFLKMTSSLLKTEASQYQF